MPGGPSEVMFFFFLSSYHFSLHRKIYFIYAKIFLMIRKVKSCDKKKKNLASAV